MQFFSEVKKKDENKILDAGKYLLISQFRIL